MLRLLTQRIEGVAESCAGLEVKIVAWINTCTCNTRDSSVHVKIAKAKDEGAAECRAAWLEKEKS
jgi:hypothetical protein